MVIIANPALFHKPGGSIGNAVMGDSRFLPFRRHLHRATIHSDRNPPFPMPYLLSIDEGTTSTRAVVYDESTRTVASAQREFTQHFPRSGWVEHDANEIWEAVLLTCREALERADIPASQIAAIGITNQRESVVVWDRLTGEPLHRIIVWQDRRTAADLVQLGEAGHEPMVQDKTGLLFDAYFSASKLSWLLREVPGLREKADRGEVAFGTLESWLICKLTGGKRHITDLSNASRTMLMEIDTGRWGPELLELFDIPPSVMPEIVPNSGSLGVAQADWFGGEIPICGSAGDQQAALFGQLCVEPGLVKCTYGTGCFMLMQVGEKRVPSRNRLLSTVGWQLEGEAPCYALEGSVFVAGSAIQWLRDGLGLIATAPEVNELAAQVPDAGGLLLVPAFTGLGAPHWDPEARGMLIGITRATTAAHLARATLESVAFQVTDLLDAMREDSGREVRSLRADGGAAASDLIMQLQADFLGVAVERPRNTETTALGAAFLAGLGAGVWKNVDELRSAWEKERVFEPALEETERQTRLRQWRRAVERAKRWETES